MVKEKSKVWVTKYLFTQGLNTFEGEIDPENLKYCYVGKLGTTLSPGEWHRTEESAIQRALAMISRKRKSIAKEILKLDSLQKEYERLTI